MLKLKQLRSLSIVSSQGVVSVLCFTKYRGIVGEFPEISDTNWDQTGYQVKDNSRNKGGLFA